jgi:hypothetical protein
MDTKYFFIILSVRKRVQRQLSQLRQLCTHTLLRKGYYVLSQAENGDEQMLGIVKFAPRVSGIAQHALLRAQFILSFLLGGGGGGMWS